MRSSAKMVVTGAIGGLAAVVVAGSGAFACTADATVGVVDRSGPTSFMPEKPVVKAGQQMTIMVKSFESNRDVVVNWLNPYTGAVTELARAGGPLYEATFTIPAASFNSRHNRPYILQAIQSGTYTRSRQVFLTGGLEWTDPLPPPIRPHEEPVTIDPVKPSTDIGAAPETPPAQVAAAAPVAGTANQAAATVAAVNTPPNDPAGSTAALPTVQAVPAPMVVSPPAPPENTAPPAGELWSGLKADASGNLLETVNGTTPPSGGGVPAGGLALLGTGILSLAGVAFEATRRRLVLAKATRQR